MDSNEHGAMEQNVKHHETNNLTYYTRETELYVETYAMMNMGTCCNRKRLREITVSLKSETLRSLVCMLVLVTTDITKIHGIHPAKMAWHITKHM